MPNALGKNKCRGRAGYRVNLPLSRIHFPDINSLYVSAMRYFLHVGKFHTVNFHYKLGFEKAREHIEKYETELNEK
jgi:hypothetical protein